MNGELEHFLFEDFYEFFKSLNPKDKTHLRLKIGKYCRMLSDQQVRNWISQKSIPFTQSNRVTKAVKQFAPLINMDSHHIEEKMLFPKYSMLIEEYEVKG